MQRKIPLLFFESLTLIDIDMVAMEVVYVVGSGISACSELDEKTRWPRKTKNNTLLLNVIGYCPT